MRNKKIGMAYTKAHNEALEFERDNPRVPLSFLAGFYQQRLNFSLGGDEALALKHHILENGVIDGDPILVTEFYKDFVYIKESDDGALAEELGYSEVDGDEVKSEKLADRLIGFQNGVFILTPKITPLTIKPRGRAINGKWELEIKVNKDGDESSFYFKDLESDRGAVEVMGALGRKILFLDRGGRIVLDFLIGDKCTISTIGDPRHRIAKVWENPLDPEQPKSVFMWDGTKIEGKTWGDVFRAIYGDDCYLTTDDEEIIKEILCLFEGLYITTRTQNEKNTNSQR